jgi:hypothetical protein
MSNDTSIDSMSSTIEPTIVQRAAHQGYVFSLEVKSFGEFLLVGKYDECAMSTQFLICFLFE